MNVFPCTAKRSKASAFTLVELLVVITIVAILAGLGMSVANASMKKARATKCLNSLRQVGVAMRAYVIDHDGLLPNTSHVRENGVSLSWLNTLSGYLGTDFISRCPANTVSRSPVTYAWNDLLTETTGSGIPVARCRTPATTLAVAEIADTYASEHFHFAAARNRVTYNQFKSSAALERHQTGANYLFVDGHVESLSPEEIKARLTATDSTFLTP